MIAAAYCIVIQKQRRCRFFDKTHGFAIAHHHKLDTNIYRPFSINSTLGVSSIPLNSRQETRMRTSHLLLVAIALLVVSSGTSDDRSSVHFKLIICTFATFKSL